MFRFVHNRIIEKTYQRRHRNKNKEDQEGTAKEKVQTPLTTEGLRRSPRITELNTGHKPVQAHEASGQAMRSCSHEEGMSQVCSLAETTPLLDQNLFSGPAKFPSIKEIEESLTPMPAIPMQAIQKVAVEVCGIPPEEVTEKLLLDKKEPTQEQGEVAGNPTPEIADG